MQKIALVVAAVSAALPIVLATADVAVAASGASGQVRSADGRYVFRFTGTVIQADRQLRATGVGQFIGDDGLLVTTFPVARADARTLELDADGQPMRFAITRGTRLCAGDKPVKAITLKPGDKVAVSTQPGQQDALSVRQGPVLFGFFGSFLRESYECPRRKP